jgi:hypothetical protein
MTTTETTEQSTAMPKPKPQKEHYWLKRLVGEWTFEGEAMMEPGQPSIKFEGVERVRALGDVWVIAEGEGEMPGGGGLSQSVMTLGYDPQKKRFVGTFITTMGANLWLYDGSLDAAEKELALESEGPSMTGDGKTSSYRDSIEIESDERRYMTSHVQQADGSWSQMMKMTYKRKT